MKKKMYVSPFLEIHVLPAEVGFAMSGGSGSGEYGDFGDLGLEE